MLCSVLDKLATLYDNCGGVLGLSFDSDHAECLSVDTRTLLRANFEFKGQTFTSFHFNLSKTATLSFC